MLRYAVDSILVLESLVIMSTLFQPIPLWDDLPGGPSAIKPYGIRLGYDTSHEKWDEALVNLEDYNLLVKSWYHASDGSNPPYHQKIAGSIENVLVRSSLATMCKSADQLAQQEGVRLLFVDGYRSPETQSGLYNFFKSKIQSSKPHLTPEELDKETLVYVTPGAIDYSAPETWFVHSTGGSIDVLLFDEKSKSIVDCGVGFDDATPEVFTDHYERLLLGGSIDELDTRLQHRRILYNAMTAAGFTNYPYEYFHYDYGTILYTVRNKVLNPDSVLQAFYGPLQNI
jgi:zinc D-Ala-D-Ala dipeptidase